MRDKRMDGRATDDVELLLIRVGHHLWRSGRRKEWAERPLFAALQAVWDAKETIRQPLRRSWLEHVENCKLRLGRHRSPLGPRTEGK